MQNIYERTHRLSIISILCTECIYNIHTLFQVDRHSGERLGTWIEKELQMVTFSPSVPPPIPGSSSLLRVLPLVNPHPDNEIASPGLQALTLNKRWTGDPSQPKQKLSPWNLIIRKGRSRRERQEIHPALWPVKPSVSPSPSLSLVP